ncbi:hypothetical protein FCOIX_7373, partial [Fusarium coicis]
MPPRSIDMALDLQHTTKAVVAWAMEDGTMQFLTRPDPKSSAITLKTWFNAEAAFFELAVPIKLKGVGVVADAILRICASSIVSLQTVKSPTIPPAIGEAFKSTTLSLAFTLSRPPAVIVHAT